MSIIIKDLSYTHTDKEVFVFQPQSDYQFRRKDRADRQ